MLFVVSPSCSCVNLSLTCFALQPMKLGEHLNSLLLNMCDDVTLSRISLRTVLDICSKHIRNSACDPPFSYIRKLVRLVLGSLSQVFCLPFWCRALGTFWNFLSFLFFCRTPSLQAMRPELTVMLLVILFFLPCCLHSAPFFTPVLCLLFFFPLRISSCSSAGRSADWQGVSSRAQQGNPGETEGQRFTIRWDEHLWHVQVFLGMKDHS